VLLNIIIFILQKLNHI